MMDLYDQCHSPHLTLNLWPLPPASCQCVQNISPFIYCFPLLIAFLLRKRCRMYKQTLCKHGLSRRRSFCMNRVKMAWNMFSSLSYTRWVEKLVTQVLGISRFGIQVVINYYYYYFSINIVYRWYSSLCLVVWCVYLNIICCPMVWCTIIINCSVSCLFGVLISTHIQLMVKHIVHVMKWENMAHNWNCFCLSPEQTWCGTLETF